jgi:hypothetical protein
MEAPLLICEPVLTETMHLLARLPRAQDELFGLLENGALNIAFCIEDHVPAVRALHQKYRSKPMSLADACIVRMAELPLLAHPDRVPAGKPTKSRWPNIPRNAIHAGARRIPANCEKR